MKLAFHSPLPPARSGVADYSALLAELRRHGGVEPDARHADIALYRLGNNALHAAIYRRAVEAPGVIIEEDSTCVRVGTALFGKRRKP